MKIPVSYLWWYSKFVNNYYAFKILTNLLCLVYPLDIRIGNKQAKKELNKICFLLLVTKS